MVFCIAGVHSAYVRSGYECDICTIIPATFHHPRQSVGIVKAIAVAVETDA
jgi:hypothetical protein